MHPGRNTGQNKVHSALALLLTQSHMTVKQSTRTKEIDAMLFTLCDVNMLRGSSCTALHENIQSDATIDDQEDV